MESEAEKNEDITVLSSTENSSTETNSKKRKRHDTGSNQTPKKTRKKNVNTPKILGQKRPIQPKTPKPATPKRKSKTRILIDSGQGETSFSWPSTCKRKRAPRRRNDRPKFMFVTKMEESEVKDVSTDSENVLHDSSKIASEARESELADASLAGGAEFGPFSSELERDNGEREEEKLTDVAEETVKPPLELEPILSNLNLPNGENVTIQSSGHEQTEDKKKDDIEAVVSCIANLANPVTPKRTPKKTRKKVHTPKILGQGKGKRPTQPKTPKPATPKRVSTKKTTPANRKSKTSSLNGPVITISGQAKTSFSCRRSLNFDTDMPLEVQSCITQVDETSESLAGSTTRLLCSWPATCKRKRAPRRRNKHPKLVFETKAEESERKDLRIDSEIVFHENSKIASETQERELTDALLAGGAEFGPSSSELEHDNGKREENKLTDVAEETVESPVAVEPMLFNLNLPNGPEVPQHEHGAEVSLLEKSRDENSDLSLTKMEGQGKLAVVRKNKLQIMCQAYTEQIREWMHQLKALCNGSEDNADEEAKKKLESDIALFHARIKLFTSCMHVFLGDRNYLRWEGSVLDSVIGVYLTQNVSDVLSSSAFMSLKAKFPIRSSSNKSDHEDLYIGDIEDIGLKAHKTSSVSPHSEGVRVRKGKGIEDKLKMTVDELLTEVQETWDWENSRSKEQGPGAKKKAAKKKAEKENEVEIEWEEVRKKYCRTGERPDECKDSVDWEAVRRAKPGDIANAIKNRGQHNNIADRIQEFLNRVVELHKSLDLEWLRHTPPDLVKKYLLEFNGLGLKSVECIRLLGLENVAFPVDTNVGRIAVRLGWVPLEPLPEELQLHLIQKYPIMDSIQKYLWPRLNTLNHLELYELHYHLITFGKVYCTKRSPKCNSCPLKADCRHYASQYASARLSLPGPKRKKNTSSSPPRLAISPPKHPEANQDVQLPHYMIETRETIIEFEKPSSPKLSQCQTKISEPNIEEPSSQNLPQCHTKNSEPVIEVPSSPKLSQCISELVVEEPSSPEFSQCHTKISEPVIDKPSSPELSECISEIVIEEPSSLELSQCQTKISEPVIKALSSPELSQCISELAYEDPSSPELSQFHTTISEPVIKEPSSPEFSKCISDLVIDELSSPELSQCQTKISEPVIEEELSSSELSQCITELFIEEPLSPELSQCHTNNSEPVIEELSLPQLSQCRTISCEPIIEEPPSPSRLEHMEPLGRDHEDLCSIDDDDDNKVQTIILSTRQPEVSTALVHLTPEETYPMPKLKQPSRLRTMHSVYELPDDHHALTTLQLEKRVDNDPLPYLLLIWEADESRNSFQAKESCGLQECGQVCTFRDNQAGSSSTNVTQQNNDTVRGTILIPCRSALRGSFPLNGTYFQVNEVFADNETSHHPLIVARESLWNLRRRLVYFGTSTSSIFRGLPPTDIAYIFWRGCMCVRGFDRRSGYPRPLAYRLHISTTGPVADQKIKEKKKKAVKKG